MCVSVQVCVSSPSFSLQLIKLCFLFSAGAEGGAIKAAFESATPRAERLITEMQSRAPRAPTATRRPRLKRAY